MYDVQVFWNASPSPTVTGYVVKFVLNNVPGKPVTVPRTDAESKGGYSRLFSRCNPGIELKKGDVVEGHVYALDGTSGLMSDVEPLNVVIADPPFPPSPPQNVKVTQVLVASQSVPGFK